jgi:hypothetical protein
VVFARVVHREHETVDVGKYAGEGVAQVGREGGDAALAGGVVAQDRDLAGDSGVDKFSSRAGSVQDTSHRADTPDDRYEVNSSMRARELQHNPTRRLYSRGLRLGGCR